MKKRIIALAAALTIALGSTASLPTIAADTLSQNTSFNKVADINLSSYSLNSYAQQFLLMSKDSFVKKYRTDSLYAKGIKVEGGLRFTAKYKGKVIGDIPVGAAKDSVIKRLGKPNLDSDEYSEAQGIKIIGYKTQNYYIIFSGDKTITDIAIVKRDHLPKGYENMLKVYLSEYLTNIDSSYDDVVKFYEKYSKFGAKNHIHGGGWKINYSFGLEIVNFFDENTVTVYNNFEGDFYDQSSIVEVEYIDKDSVFLSEIYYYNAQSYLDSAIKREGKQSPNKKLVAYADNDGLYSSAYILIRQLDGSKSDKEISVGYFTGDLKWLSNRYLFFTAMFNGMYIYDASTGSKRELTKEFEKSKDSYREYTLKTVDSKKIVYLDRNNKQVILSYSFDKTGKIIIKRTK